MTITFTPQELKDHEKILMRYYGELVDTIFKKVFKLERFNLDQEIRLAVLAARDEYEKNFPHPQLLQ